MSTDNDQDDDNVVRFPRHDARRRVTRVVNADARLGPEGQRAIELCSEIAGGLEEVPEAHWPVIYVIVEAFNQVPVQERQSVLMFMRQLVADREDDGSD